MRSRILFTHFHRGHRNEAAAALLTIALAACTRGDPPGAGVAPAANTAGATSSSASSRAPHSAAAHSSAPAASAYTTLAPSASAKATAPEIDWDNKAQPSSASPELEASARALFDAIVANEPLKAKDFFFPREPFTPLKDVKEPDAYWRNLFSAYEHDIGALSRKHRDWTGATFDAFEIGSAPGWVKPGDEYNKIGYFRTFGARLHYRVQGTRYTLKVHTLISWQGRWTVTHLQPFK